MLLCYVIIVIQLTVRSAQEGVWSVSALLDSSMLLASEEYKWRIIQRLFEILEKDSKKTEPAQHSSSKYAMSVCSSY